MWPQISVNWRGPLQAACKVCEYILMLAGHSPKLQGSPIPCWVQIGNNRRVSRQHRFISVPPHFVAGFFETEPMASRHIRSINGESHEVGRRPLSDGLLNIAVIEIASPLRAHSTPFHHTAHGNRKPNVHQPGFFRGKAIERL